jgi:hypothetical protein
MDHPTIKRFEKLAVADKPEPGGFNISLSPDAIFAIGLIMLQWAALYESIKFSIDMLRGHPTIPDDLRAYNPDKRQKTNLTYLRELGRYAYADAREGAARMFDRNICHIFAFKNDRDKLAHGTFALNDNKDFDGVRGTYEGRKFNLSAKRIRNVAEGISRCHGLLFNFDMWVHAEEHLRGLRTLHERCEQQDPASDSRPEDNPHTP